jgi:transcriptional regulator with XRE-family HTH domain
MSTPNWRFFMETFGERLESLRGDKSQKQFAASLGLPINTYTNWVRGIREPSMSALINLSTRLGVSSDWLIGINKRRPAENAESKVADLKKAIITLLKEY